MEEYPEELRTPPVRLVSLVGCPELHAAISTHLHSEQPPIHTLAFPDLSKISLLIPSSPSHREPAAADSPPAGVLKKDWLLKHRTKMPAVVAALFPSDHISGDPTQWLQLCSDLDYLKATIRAKNIKLVVVIVHSNSRDDINEDRMLSLRKRAEVDSKYVLFFNPNNPSELKQSLNRVGSTFSELANLYYKDEGRRIKTRIEKKATNFMELNVRYCFKVAIYAEFRRDWVEALRFYEDAYNILREMVGKSTRLPPIQRLVEIRAVAEQLHFKISTLLLHSGKVIEAITWFHQHIASYKRLVGAPETIFLHWEWMSKQFLVFAELLETSSAAIQNISSPALGTSNRTLTEWEFRPAYYFKLAATYLKEKRLSLELVLSMFDAGNETDSSADSMVPSVYIGQFTRLIELGDALIMQPLTDEEFTLYAVSEAKRFQDSFEIIALLKKSCESYGNVKAERMGSLCGFQMAREYFASGDYKQAKQIFDGIASLYRQEGWVSLLWEVLGFLRECSRNDGVVKDFVEYSLEMAALPVSTSVDIQSLRNNKESCPAGPATLSQRETIQKEVFQLVRGESGLEPIEQRNHLKVDGDSPLHLEIDLVSPLRSVLLASVAFHEQVIKPGASTLITVSLLSQSPVTMEIDQLEVQFNQSSCNFIIANPQKNSTASMADPSQRIEIAPSLSLATNKWLRMTYEIKFDHSGKLECTSVIVKMGPHFTICCRAESPASMDDLPLWKFEDRVETFPTKDPALAFSGQKVTQVEEPDPEVDLILGAAGPALVGESFTVPVTVVSKGHSVFSGELKINLVDVRGGGLFSPRETDSSTTGHHVELLGISGIEEDKESHDDLMRVQQSFGLISVPYLESGESWSGKLEIKWHRPKPIMLYVSLGYSPHDNGPNSQKVHVHRSLQIEGKTAVTINHHFMLPLRRGPLLLSRIKAVPQSDQSLSLPLSESSILIVTAKNCTEVPLQIVSVTIEEDEDGVGNSCTVRQHSGDDLLGTAQIMPGEEFKKIFAVVSATDSSKLKLGSVCIRWKRIAEIEGQSDSTDSSVLTKQRLPDVNLESPPLVVSLECPPYTILGDPFTYSIKVHNHSRLLQEIKFSLADAQSFVLSGSHNDTIFVLPKSEHVLSYKLVPLASGMQQLPKFTLTSLRHSTSFQPSAAASSVFVFPSKPHFKMADVKNTGTAGSLAVE